MCHLGSKDMVQSTALFITADVTTHNTNNHNGVNATTSTTSRPCYHTRGRETGTKGCVHQSFFFSILSFGSAFLFSSTAAVFSSSGSGGDSSASGAVLGGAVDDADDDARGGSIPGT